jgi:SNF2 family DNA or RNA helicase
LELTAERRSTLGESLRVSNFELMRMGTDLGEGMAWEGADRIRDLLAQLQAAQLEGHALPQTPMPQGLAAELRPYQHQGLNWLQFLRRHHLGGILADDMGLGKTLQTLAHILAEKEAGKLIDPVLIVCPVSVLGNWRREAQRFAPSLRVQVVHGLDRHVIDTDAKDLDIVVAPYSLLQRDRERWLKRKWSVLVLDEAQHIKNASTQAAKVVQDIKAAQRLCLTGTPLENHLGELWSLFHFVMPGFLGSASQFKSNFRTPIEMRADLEQLDRLRRRITPFILRRTKAAVAIELPPKVETIQPIALSGKQADLYETIRLSTEQSVRDALAEKGLARSQIQVLDALLKLRQVCCDPRLVPSQRGKSIAESAKLERLMDLLPELIEEGRKVLLFSQFTSMLSLIEEALAKQGGIRWVKLTGESKNREAIIEQFTSGEVPLFLISLKAGGTGLNLQAADTVIHYDPWWNPAVENQATDRAHRIGQTQQVMVYKLVAEGTIEERMLALQARKAELADGVLSGSHERKEAMFTESDLQELLRPLDA